MVKEIDACMGFITKNVDDLEFLLEKTMGKSVGGQNWHVNGHWQPEKYITTQN